jgi:hypothetical protein
VWAAPKYRISALEVNLALFAGNSDASPVLSNAARRTRVLTAYQL